MFDSLSILLEIIFDSCFVGHNLLAASAYRNRLLKTKKTENAKVTLDLNEGNKRRIVAPIEEKEIIDVTRRPHPLNIKKQIIKSNQETKLKYYMTVKEFSFPLTED